MDVKNVIRLIYVKYVIKKIIFKKIHKINVYVKINSISIKIKPNVLNVHQLFQDVSHVRVEQHVRNVTQLLILYKIQLMENVTVWILIINNQKLKHVYYVHRLFLIVLHVNIQQC
jgi:hypothetical protein